MTQNGASDQSFVTQNGTNDTATVTQNSASAWSSVVQVGGFNSRFLWERLTRVGPVSSTTPGPMSDDGSSFAIPGVGGDPAPTVVTDCPNVAISKSANPRGAVDAVVTADGQVTVSGWAFDANTSGPIRIQVRVNARLVAIVVAGDSRDDLCQFGHGGGHGFTVTAPYRVTGKPVLVSVAAVNVGRGRNVVIGNARV